VIEWAQRGQSLPFTVITDRQLAREAGGYDIIIIDTKGRPEEDDLREMVEYSDMVVVPCFAEAQALGTLRHLREKFQKLNSAKYRILLTNIPPLPQQDGPQCRALLIELEIPLFDTPIRSLKAFKKASFAGTTVATLRDDPRASLGWSDYQAVGEQIEALLGLPDLYSESPVIEESELSLQEALI
jgi:chromosome partitioning protein